MDKFNSLAYRITVWDEVYNLLRDKYFPDTGDVPVLICPNAFRSAKEVPPVVIQEVLSAINNVKKQDEDALRLFHMGTVTSQESTKKLVKKVKKKEVTNG
jgi:hypothetical protein